MTLDKRVRETESEWKGELIRLNQKPAEGRGFATFTRKDQRVYMSIDQDGNEEIAIKALRNELENYNDSIAAKMKISESIREVYLFKGESGDYKNNVTMLFRLGKFRFRLSTPCVKSLSEFVLYAVDSMKENN